MDKQITVAGKTISAINDLFDKELLLCGDDRFYSKDQHDKIMHEYRRILLKLTGIE